MELKFSHIFNIKLQRQLDFIANDKPSAARKFKIDLIKALKSLAKMPFQCRKSIFFDSEEIRDMVFKGYVIIYKVDTLQDQILVFGIVNFDENPTTSDSKISI